MFLKCYVCVCQVIQRPGANFEKLVTVGESTGKASIYHPCNEDGDMLMNLITKITLLQTNYGLPDTERKKEKFIWKRHVKYFRNYLYVALIILSFSQTKVVKVLGLKELQFRYNCWQTNTKSVSHDHGICTDIQISQIHWYVCKKKRKYLYIVVLSRFITM